MGLFHKEKIDIIKEIYKQDKLQRYASFLVGILIVAIAFNVLLLPNDIVYGISGLAVILKKLYGIDPSLVILIGSLIFKLYINGKRKNS